ncbi:glutamate receptor U1 isoform X2 [Thunnus albacares]|uniref:glutamate receptor U1 n=1 Tax=Thunnus maccoyii TaxID=8240 RepID=UPI001C4BA1E9|nr:glutamate receptor U1 [Thunnus maccoyii]XP_042258060.1 glutamate receptor U1 [Thunnus maccoyii]XP_042258069.1 glutamate receptor U1 [Thunnus maccoyii]XP_042258077.1 glutamate receptor U1 [Thunnus maccoyii]XP_042258084.1 glutamate receptor U1 [Thunnus maccoyii]XP_042258090.1 glutamate receptor U1 [Thunnus maccoyii]XP_042258099.1 glutamate receptor U1 [Thunnus maccoyii]XP_044205897.1 glutamate receptor U1 isoform X2 [Thunnus albacares]
MQTKTVRMLFGLFVLSAGFFFNVGICTAELRITTIKQEPYTMSKGSQLEGFCMDLLSEIAKKLGFKYKVQLVRDSSYGRQDESGNWNGMIGEVVRGEADLAIAPLTLTAAREKAVGMTKPFMQTGISILLRKDISEGAGFFDFLTPFTAETWVGILIAYLGTAACIFIVARLSPCEWSQPQSEQNRFSLIHSLWYTAGALTLQGAGPHPRALSGRVICCSWWLFSIVLLACYFSNLSSSKSSESTHLTVKGFEDLANQDTIQYGCLAGSSTLAFFRNSNNPVYRRIHEHMERTKSFVSSMDEGIRRAKEGNYAFIGESVSLDLAVARHCELVRAHEVIGMRGYSIAAPLGSPIIKNLSIAILQLSEAGELAYLRSKWWASSCMAGKAKSSAVQPHSLKGMFLILSLGLGLGTLLAVLELTSRSRSSAADQRKTCCTVLTEELSLRLRNNNANKPQEAADKDKEKA